MRTLAKQVLSFELVWRDEDAIEIRVVVSNGRFSGETRLYAQAGSSKQWANQLAGFPKSPNDVRELKLGTFEVREAGGGISMRLFCSDKSGHSKALVRLASKTPEQEDVTLTLRVEAAQIDDFVQQLRGWSEQIGDKALFDYTP